MSIPLILAAVMSTAPGSCSWAHPGANPYRGDPVAALSDFKMSDDERKKLKVLMAGHQYTDVVKITRDDIVGRDKYSDLREMHSGHGSVCHGAVDRSSWSDKIEERGLVYCVGEQCVVVPTVCNNVSLITRKPEVAAAALPDVGPIDIEPAAGPAATPGMAPASDMASPLAEASPPPDSFEGVPGAGAGPLVPGYGEGPCCSTVTPTVPVTPTSPVPELPTGWLMLAGLGVLTAYARRRWQA